MYINQNYKVGNAKNKSVEYTVAFCKSDDISGFSHNALTFTVTGLAEPGHFAIISVRVTSYCLFLAVWTSTTFYNKHWTELSEMFFMHSKNLWRPSAKYDIKFL